MSDTTTVWEAYDATGRVWARVEADDEYEAVKEAAREMRAERGSFDIGLYTRRVQ